MIQYLNILLDDTSTSYCHYNCEIQDGKLIPIEVLKDAIFYAMKENWMVQFVYPKFELPESYWEVINSIDHFNIMPNDSPDVQYADVIVFENNIDINGCQSVPCVLRISKDELFSSYKHISNQFCEYNRLNVVITDIDSFKDSDFEKYKAILSHFSSVVVDLLKKGKDFQLNIITDRMMLLSMNNCCAGVNNITLAPDGNFYVCPAFYQAPTKSNTSIGETYSVGSLVNGLNIKNPQLYKFSHAPLCNICDAYHCKRCVWLNRITTLEVNIPSHEQCVVSHLERNASKEVQENLKDTEPTQFLTEIPHIDYLDPLDVY